MIALLRGRVVVAELTRAIVDVGGVGYEVFAPGRVIRDWSVSEDDVVVHVSTQVREDAIALYGFATPEEREGFQVLLGVSGVGPKVALACLDALALGELRRAVELDDVRTLGQIKGVGKRTAQRLALELKGKLPATFDAPQQRTGTPPPRADDALALALARLGFTRVEITRASQELEARGIAPDTPVADRLRAALKLLYEK